MSNSHSNPANFFSHLAKAQQRLNEGFANLPPAPEPTLNESAAAILLETATRLQDNYPYAHPLYAGQMLKPPHPIARAAYALAMSINPNNHALDGGRASSAMELEAVAALARMFGSRNTSATSPAEEPSPTSKPFGSPANSTPARPSPPPTRPTTLTAASPPSSACPSSPSPPTRTGRMDLTALEQALQTQNIGTVVATLGTTAVGAVDPLDRLLALQQQYGFRIHVDAAYGGYFTLACNLSPAARAAFDAIPHADSLVVDPHKHGLQPYGCGGILFRDPTVGRFYKHDSPYTYFSSQDLHLGEISLECSRAGASAVALWATQRLLPYTPAANSPVASKPAAGCDQSPRTPRRRPPLPYPHPSTPTRHLCLGDRRTHPRRIFQPCSRHLLSSRKAGPLPRPRHPPARLLPVNRVARPRKPFRNSHLPPVRPDEARTSPLAGSDLAAPATQPHSARYRRQYPLSCYRSHRNDHRPSVVLSTYRFGTTSLGPFSSAADGIVNPYRALRASDFRLR